MADEKNNNILSFLRNGAEVKCLKCKLGVYHPYGAPADKAHSFICDNEECEDLIQWDSQIEIE